MADRGARGVGEKIFRLGFLSPGGFQPGSTPGRLAEEIPRQLAAWGVHGRAPVEKIPGRGSFEFTNDY